MKASEIEAIVDKLLELKKTTPREVIDTLPEFSDFKTGNRHFYEMVLNEIPFDVSIYKQMMSMKRKLEEGEDQYSVDVKFGEFMAEKYINPFISKKK